MIASRPRIVHFLGQPRSLAVLVMVLAVPVTAAAQSSPFTGPYIAVDVSRQQVIGGALVDGVDTLQEDTRLVTSGAAGLRTAVRGVVLGAELGVGALDGDLARHDGGSTVTYSASRQWHWALLAGPALGARTLLYAYLSEVTRSFDVAITRGAGSETQQDEQGLLRFGLGLERRLAGAFHVRLAAGTSRADFGSRLTNIEPGRRLELSAGLVWQF